MTGPREWRHAEGCAASACNERGCCSCTLSAVRDAIDQGHRVVLGSEGVEGRLGTELDCSAGTVALRNDDGDLMFDPDETYPDDDWLYRIVPLEPS